MSEMRGLDVLVIEDSAVQGKIIGQMLSPHVRSAQICASAFGLISTPEIADDSFDLALVDINLEDGSGLDLIEPIRTSWPGIVVVVMTMNSSDGFGGLAIARERGADLVLSKPFKPSDIVDILRDVRRIREGRPRRPHVVVIDDSAAICKLMSQFLDPEDFRVSTFVNAEEAIQRLNYDYVSVIVTDVIMPGMSGDQVIRLVRDIWPNVCVIAMTGAVELTGDRRNKAIELGAQDVVTLRAVPRL